MGLARGGGQDEPPFVLVEKERGALRVAAVDSLAAEHRLAIGMTLAEARALSPGVASAPADQDADADCLRAAAAACEMFTPLVALRDSGGLILDITGCAHLFGGEEALLRQCRQRLAHLGLRVRASVAGTPDAAWAFARFTKGGIVPPGAAETLARHLDVAALEQETATTVALARAGLKTLGELADRPAHMLTARFGGGLVAALRRILGREDIRIAPLRAPPDIMAEKHFPEPLAHMESLLGALERLAGDIARVLERRAGGGRGFEASFFRADGAVRRLKIETTLPTRDPQGVTRLFSLRLAALTDPLDPGFGFDAIRLSVTNIQPLEEKQATLAGETETGEGPDALAALIDRLIARFGRENVLRCIARDTHDPDRASVMAPYLAAPAAPVWLTPETDQPPMRPLTLFARPHLIETLAETPDGPPLRFRWRRMLHDVARAEGPERIAPEWWQDSCPGGAPAPATRDYYRVEDAQGRRFWIFREGLYEDSNARPRWFLHGLFA